jgi:putative mRNA 3-end processing factor
MTEGTRQLAKILIKDFMHVESLTITLPYTKDNMSSVFNEFHAKPFKQRFRIKDCEFMFFDAGHIPGSAIVVIEADGKRLAYTGDINLSPTRLMKGADINIGEIDALITETTYGDKEHPNREETEKNFMNKAKETIKRGGSVFIPVFGVGRAQEILLLIHTQQWNTPIYLDGMSQEVTDLIIQNNWCKDLDAMKYARSNTTYLNGRQEREAALQRQGIFITTSGMLTGGPILQYLKEGYADARNSILLTGYVIEGTNGRLLMDEGSIFLEGKKVMVKAEYHQYDFSAHSGLNELQRMLQKLNPKKLILVHGDPSSLEGLAEDQRKKGRDVFIPGIGDEIYI